MNKLIIGSAIAVIAGVVSVIVYRKRKAEKEQKEIIDAVGKITAMANATENGKDTFTWNGKDYKIRTLTFDKN